MSRRWIGAGLAVCGVMFTACSARPGPVAQSTVAPAVSTPAASSAAATTPSTTPSSTPLASVPAVRPSASLRASPARALGLACATAPLNANNTWGWGVPAGSPVSISASFAGTTATLHGVAATTNGNPTLSRPALTITRRGHAAVTIAVTPPAQARAVEPWDIGRAFNQPGGWQPLCVASFAGQPGPTAILGLDLGGAHCCLTLRAFFVGPDGTVSTLDRDLGNAGAVTAMEAGEPIIRTEDNAFAYEFTDYAGSGMPVRILTVSNYRFVDVTTRYPDLVRAEAATWWTAYQHSPQDPLGMLAAWAADECVIGQCTHAFSVIDQLNAQGKLNGPQGWPSGTAYVRALRSFLAQHGYLTG